MERLDKRVWCGVIINNWKDDFSPNQDKNIRQKKSIIMICTPLKKIKENFHMGLGGGVSWESNSKSRNIL